MAITDGNIHDTSNALSLGSGVDGARVEINKAEHLPGHMYWSPDIFELEKEKLFMQDWLCMGRIEEIENPGDYMTFRVLGEPVIIARDEAGKINAFSNVCRHRGVEVASESGNLKEFSCPYHGWTYDLEGKLIGAPYMKEANGFDPTKCRLSPLKSDQWAGWIFICFNDEVVSLKEFLADYIADFDFLRQEDLRLADKMVVDMNCNWKFGAENVMDVYHIWAIHLATFAAAIDVETFPFDLKKRGGFSSFYDGAPMVEGGKPVMRRIPWLEERGDSFCGTGFAQPNLHMFARVDQVVPFVSWPLTPTSYRLVMYHMFPPDHFIDPDFDAKVQKYHEFMNQVVEEDREMIESLQRGAQSTLFQPGRMSVMEKSIHNTINGYLERLFEK